MCHVLIIEDEPLMAMLIRDLLEDEGVTSFTIAETQDEAVAAAHETMPALITSDVKLRFGTGPLAVALIHQSLGDIPVIFITGTPDDCRPRPFPAPIITKPFVNAAIGEAYRQMRLID